MRGALLAVALLPYLGLAARDGWMHAHDRRVPRLEQWLHAGIFVGVSAAVYAAFMAGTPQMLAALCLLLPCVLADELGFHGALDARERRLHYAAYTALAAFIACWWLTRGMP